MRLPIGIAVVGACLGATAAWAQDPSVADRASRAKACIALSEGYQSRNPQKMQEAFVADPALKGSFTYEIKAGPAMPGPQYIDVVMVLKKPDGSTVKLPPQKMQGPGAVITHLKRFKMDFALTSGLSAGEVIAEVRKSYPNVPQKVLNSIQESESWPASGRLPEEARNAVWDQIHKNISEPYLARCQADNLIDPDTLKNLSDPVAREALAGRNAELKLIGCEWSAGAAPRFIPTSKCGTYCTGSAHCTYEVKGKKQTYERVIGCKGSLVGDQVYCGTATDCHKDPIRFPAAVAGPAPGGQSSGGGRDSGGGL